MSSIVQIPKESNKDYPNRIDNNTLELFTGDQSMEGYFNNTVLCTHNTNSNAPEVVITCKRFESRPNLNKDGSIIIVSSGRNVDEELEYSTAKSSSNLPSDKITATVTICTDNFRVNTKKNQVLSSGKKIIISSVDDIIIESAKNLKLIIKGNIEVEAQTVKIKSNSTEIGKFNLKKLVNETFMSLFNSHVHMTSQGISSPPNAPMLPVHLTSNTKAQ